MEIRRPIVPIGLPISAALLLGLGLILQPVIRGLPEELLIKNTILNGVPFILIFVAIVLFFIVFIWILASVLNNNVPAHIHTMIERITIAGIVLGVIGMFQPWWFAGYRLGFHLLLISTLAFIVWSHIIPKGIQLQEEDPGPASTHEVAGEVEG